MATEITYKGAVIAAPEGGQTATLKCKGMVMADDVVVKVESGSADEGWIGDGNTHIWISLAEGRTSPMLGVRVNGTVVVDWGDGTTPDVLMGTDIKTTVFTPNHNYAKVGDYVITLSVDGEMHISGAGLNKGTNLLTRNNTPIDNDYAYQTEIKRVELVNCVTGIDDYAFWGCYNLTSIYISDSVTSIGYYAFYHCTSLQIVNIPNSVTSIGADAFDSCNSLTSIDIPESVTYVGMSAFSGCESLTSINIFGSITGHAMSLVSWCYCLKNITIGNGTKVIPNQAFHCCFSLTSIIIPESVTEVSCPTFSYCYGLTKIRFESSTPPVFSSKNWGDISSECIISVPVGCLDAYKTAANYPDPNIYTYIEE